MNSEWTLTIFIKNITSFYTCWHQNPNTHNGQKNVYFGFRSNVFLTKTTFGSNENDKTRCEIKFRLLVFLISKAQNFFLKSTNKFMFWKPINLIYYILYKIVVFSIWLTFKKNFILQICYCKFKQIKSFFKNNYE